MRSTARWGLVALLAAFVVATPPALALVPANDTDLSSAQVLRLIERSSGASWSGDVRTRGTLQIPDTDSFAGTAQLLGEENDLRVWWRNPEQWRVDRVRQTGETDLVRQGDQLTSWVFESETATISPYSGVRLPDASDLLPTRLASRLLAGARTAELSSLPARRVAGRDTAGLRLTPSGEQTTIGRVDVWADVDTGLPLLVEVVPKTADRPILVSTVRRLDTGRPSADTVDFEPPDGVRVRMRDAFDLAAGANVFAPFALPDTLAGLDRRGSTAELGAVGVYGRGPTAVVAVPLRRGTAERARDQLSKAASAQQTDGGTALTVGPLSVLLTDRRRGPGVFLVAGTVTPETLQRAADDLAIGVRQR